MVSLRPVQACFAILYTVGGVIDHPPPPHSSWNWLSVTALSALSVLGAAGTSWVNSRTATRGVDASDVDADISSRHIQHIFLFVLACLLVRCWVFLAARMLHFTLDSRHVGGDSKFSLFPPPGQNSCAFFKNSFGNCGAWRPMLSFFPRAFCARGSVGG